MTGPLQRIEVTYTGRVQGVGFRATARAVARTHGVSGWVFNQADGSVRAQFQAGSGPIGACLAELAEVMKKNIAGSEERELAPVEGESGFTIRYEPPESTG